MANYQEKIDSLYEDLELAVREHDRAVNQVVAAKELILSIQGGISVLHELQEDQVVAAKELILSIQGGISVLHELQEDEAIDSAHTIVAAL